MRIFIIGILSCLCLNVYGNQFQSHQAIEKAVKKFVLTLINQNSHQHENVAVKVNKIDSRLKLAECQQPLNLYLPKHQKKTRKISIVGVSCRAPKPWAFYVRVQTTISIPIVVTRHTITKGQVITAQDLTLQEYDVNHLQHGYFNSLTAVEGMVAKRTIGANNVLTPLWVKAPIVIKRGQEVLIIATNNGLHIEMHGIAKRSGSLNQRIPVINKSSKRIIEAVVISRDRVRVPL